MRKHLNTLQSSVKAHKHHWLAALLIAAVAVFIASTHSSPESVSADETTSGIHSVTDGSKVLKLGGYAHVSDATTISTSGDRLDFYKDPTGNALGARFGGLYVGAGYTMEPQIGSIKVHDGKNTLTLGGYGSVANPMYIATTAPGGIQFLTDTGGAAGLSAQGIYIGDLYKGSPMPGSIHLQRDNADTAITLESTAGASYDQSVRFKDPGMTWYVGGRWSEDVSGFGIGMNNQKSDFVIDTQGNVGIGSVNPQSKLAVNGTITAKEVKVLDTGWADYVFDDDYTPMPLAELAAYIEENKHLPNVPTDEEIARDGVSLGDTQRMLLEKVEELTLYVLGLDKEMRELREENKLLKEHLTHDN